MIVEEDLTKDPRFDDHYLLRFLRAREFDLKETHKMFANFIEWREKHGANNAIVGKP